MTLWDALKNKKLRIYFDDGSKIAWKVGVLTGVDDVARTIFILDEKSGQSEGISLDRYVRHEVVE